MIDYQVAAEEIERRIVGNTAQPALASEPRILERLAEILPALGLVGEDRNAKLLYLVMTSRVLSKPVSAVVKGDSSVGKSHTVEIVLDLFPSESYFGGTSLSPKSLFYSPEDFAHRMLVVFEAAGMADEGLQYVVRSLLSEGRIEHHTVQPGSLKPVHIVKEGPTGLIITTTRVKLYHDNETRLLSITADDSAEQTAAVLHRLVQEDVIRPDAAPWRELQAWIGTAEQRVTIPYAKALANLIPPVAVRLRRDVQAVLSLIRAHAILHQLTRDRDEQGRIVAAVEDYASVRELVVDLISEGVGKSVKVDVRETVAVVARLKTLSTDPVTFARLGECLNLDKSAARRRALVAIDGGYVRNKAEKGKPADLVVGDPLPEDVMVLPRPEQVASS
jgi:hypothetical protein